MKHKERRNYLGHCYGPTGSLISKSIKLVSCFENQQSSFLKLYTTLDVGKFKNNIITLR